MSTAWKINVLAGNVPYVAVAILCAGSFMGGRVSQPPRDKVALVEKGAVLLEAILEHRDATPQQMADQISRPIRDVLNRYVAQGYTVIDVSKDDHGYMEVAAYPSDAIDITDELRAAVRLPPAGSARTAPTAVSPMSAKKSASLSDGRSTRTATPS